MTHIRRAQRGKHALQRVKLPVTQVQPGKQRQEQARWQDAAERGCQRTGYARKPCPDKRGRVDRNRARGHFRDGDKIGELLQTEQTVLRDDHIPAAECKRAEIQRGKKQLFQHLFPALHPIRLQSYAAMRRAALTIVPQEAGL